MAQTGVVADVSTMVVEEIKVPPQVIETGEWTERKREKLRLKIKKLNKKKGKLDKAWEEMPKKFKFVPLITVVDVQQQVVVAQPPAN